MSRNDLYRKVWSKSAVQLAKDWGISDVAIAKLCKKHNVPKPPLGYWARIQHGQKIRRPVLPKADDERLEVVRFQRYETSQDRPVQDPETAAKIAAEKDASNQIVVADQLIDPHPLVERTHKSIASAAADERSIVRPKAKQCLSCALSCGTVTNRNENAFGGGSRGRDSELKTRLVTVRSRIGNLTDVRLLFLSLSAFSTGSRSRSGRRVHPAGGAASNASSAPTPLGRCITPRGLVTRVCQGLPVQGMLLPESTAA